MNAPTDRDREMVSGILAGLQHIGFSAVHLADLATDTRRYLSTDLSERDKFILSYRDIFYQLNKGRGAGCLPLLPGEENAL